MTRGEPASDPVLALVRGALAGDRASEGRLIRELLVPTLDAAVSKYLFGNAKRRYEREDIVQEVLAHLCENRWERLRPYDPEKGALSTYVWAVTRHWIRDHARRRPPPDPVEDPEKDLPPDSGPEGKAYQAQLLRRVFDALDEDKMLLFRWTYLEPLERPELARRLQISMEALYRRIQRLEALVKSILSNPEGTLHTSEGARS